MSREPVVLDINYKEIRGLKYQSTFTGKFFSNPRRVSFQSANEKERAHEMEWFLTANFPDVSGIYLNIPYESQFIREFTLPFLDKKKIKEILPFELEATLPYEPGEYVYDYYTYPDAENGQTRIFVIGAARENIFPYLEIFQRIKVPVFGLYSPLDAVYQLSRFVQKDTYGFIHISPITTMVIMVQNYEWRYARILPLGLDVLIHNIAQNWRSSFEESEKIFFNLPSSKDSLHDELYLKHFSLSKKQAQALDDMISEFTRKMAGEISISIQKSIPQSYDNPSGFPLYISSDYANSELMESLISAEIKFPIYTFPYEKTPVALLNKEYTLCVAGAFSQTDSGLKFIDRVFKRYVGSKNSVAVVPMVFGLVFTLVMLVSAFWMNYSVKKSEVTAMEKKHEAIYQKYFGHRRLNPDLSHLANAQMAMKKTEETTRLYRIFFKTPSVSEILYALDEKTRPFQGNMVIENIDYKSGNKSLFLSGSIESFSLLNDLKNSILESPHFEKADVDSGKRPGKYGKDEVKFSMKISIREKKDDAT